MGKASAKYLTEKTGLKAQLIGGSKAETIEKSKALFNQRKKTLPLGLVTTKK